jgi:dUTP pyrophosphatase
LQLFYSKNANLLNEKNIPVKIINKSNNPEPSYATAGSSGMDIRAFVNETLVLEPMQRFAVPTGLYVEIPNGFEIQIRSRSGLAINHGISCLNAPGTIDSDYRGEIKVILINLSKESFTINSGDRIAQMVLAATEKIEWNLVETIDATERGEGGFGHTGK